MIKTSRRDFLKGAAAIAGTAALTKGVFEKTQANNRAAGSQELTFEPKGLDYYPPFEKWNDWKEPAGDYWKKHGGSLRDGVKMINYMIVPTVCNNCEAQCGLTAWIDKDTMTVRKFMGNPFHVASRGRNCAKGYASLAQMYDPDRIPFPLKRAPGSKRGENKWVRTTWEEALETIGKKMREVLLKGDEISRKQIMYHVGRPNEKGFHVRRVVHSWGVDGRNTHTNICSSNGRFGNIITVGDDRTAPDFANSRLIILVSSHAADAGHYYQQHAGYIADARAKGAKLVVIDPRMSNSAGMADLWIPAWPGSEAAINLAMISRLLRENKFDRNFVERWFNWKEFITNKEYLNYLKENGFLTELPKGETFDDFIETLKDIYKDYTFEWAAQEARIPVYMLDKLYEMIVWAGNRITQYHWRAVAAGNRGGWMGAGRTGTMLLAFTGSIGGPGGVGWYKWYTVAIADKGGSACVAETPEPVKAWNELLWPPEWPLASYELSFLLPHLLMDDEWRDKWKERGLKIPEKVEVWFGRIYNPVWINPDGFRWVEALQREDKFGLNVYLSPTWSETAFYCDYILPMGLAGERFEQASEPTRPDRWAVLRQPVLRIALQKMGWKPTDPAKATLEAHKKVGLGEIWEESEFFVNLAFAIDPDGSLGIRKYWESKQNPGKPVTMEEYYNAVFANLPKLSQVCQEMGITPFEYMRDRGAWTEESEVYNVHEKPLPYDPEKKAYKYEGKWIPEDEIKIENGLVYHIEEDGKKHKIGVYKDGKIIHGWKTPSGHIEFFSKTMVDWKWPEYAIPIYPRNKEERQKMIHIVSQVHHDYITEPNAFVLNPIYRLPYLIHTRSINAKWLMEIGQNHNPIWIYKKDAERLGIKRGDAIKLRVIDTLTGIETGYFVGMAMPTEATRPGVLACSHHNGRWRLVNEVKIPGFRHELGVMRMGSVRVDIKTQGGKYFMRTVEGVKAFESWQYPEFNKDTEQIWWKGTSGVFQNAVFPATPDPLSGMHCWHKKVLVEKAGPEDRIGDVFVDINKTFEVYKAWRDQLTRPAPGPDGYRRPKWMPRPWFPIADEYWKFPSA